MEITSKKCACKGIRRCLLCDISNNLDQKNKPLKTYVYCPHCQNRAYELKLYEQHLNNHIVNDEILQDTRDSFLKIDGVYLQTDVVTYDEEIELIKQIDSFEWIDSQSGRRKQDFGPKINFKKKKINFSSFNGLPKLDVEILKKIKNERLKKNNNSIRFTKIIHSEQKNRTILDHFQAVEICHLEYCPERGSSIDAHFDDFWIWGERLVTLNLLSSTVITLTLPNSIEYCIRIICPRRSILVLYGDARYCYHHSIRRSDIEYRRLAITYRELPFSFFDTSNENHQLIEEFMNRARNLIVPIK